MPIAPEPHVTIEPNILYFGTPVVLLSTVNPDGSANLAPMSSVFWLGQQAVLGLDEASATTQNLMRTGECVLNLPSDAMAGAVNRLALTTGTDPVPAHKQRRGYRHEPDKFGLARLTERESDQVAPPRAAECPVAMEAVLTDAHPLGGPGGPRSIVDVRIERVHVHEGIRMAGTADRVDPDAWRPLIMSFQQLYGLGPRTGPSRLAQIPEDLYGSRPVATAAR